MKRILLLALFLAAAPLHAQWKQYADVKDAGYDAAALAAVRDYADSVKSAAVLAVAEGHVISAWGDVDRKLELHSVRKSLYSALWGIAESRGLVNLNATLAELGVDDLHSLTAEEKKARLVDLLHARSGVYHESAYAPSDQEEERPARGSHAPDTFWFYNNWDFNVAGALLEQVTGKPMGVLFDEWIARPLGMEDYRPGDVFAAREPGRSRWPALTFRLSARDLARFGAMWLDGGRWKGRQVVPKEWVARASTPASQTGGPGEGYAMMWWTYEPSAVDAQRYPNASRVRVIMGRGTGGQVVAVVPEAHLVFVHRADTDNGRHVRGSDVWTMLDRILGARRGAARANARLVPLRVEKLASALPPFVWPSAIALDEKAMKAVTGDYELKPGVVARVFIDGGKLYASMPGQGEAELFAISPAEFFVRVDPSVRARFDEQGVVVTMGGRELRAARVTAEAHPVH